MRLLYPGVSAERYIVSKNVRHSRQTSLQLELRAVFVSDPQSGT
jgi:hypothetical protein